MPSAFDGISIINNEESWNKEEFNFFSLLSFGSDELDECVWVSLSNDFSVTELFFLKSNGVILLIDVLFVVFFVLVKLNGRLMLSFAFDVLLK